MKKFVLILIGLILCVVTYVKAQEKFIGFNAGSIIYHGENSDGTSLMNNYLMGIKVEYRPQHAPFSVELGLQYLSDNNYIQIPLNLNFLIGNKFKFKFIGGIVPLIRLKVVAPNKTFVIGGQFGIGIDYKIRNKYVIFSDYTIYAFPKSVYGYSQAGSVREGINRELEAFACINIGIKYLIRKNTK